MDPFFFEAEVVLTAIGGGSNLVLFLGVARVRVSWQLFYASATKRERNEFPPSLLKPSRDSNRGAMFMRK